MPNYKNIVKKIAKTRMLFLFERANNIFPENQELANRYIYLARKYASRAKLRVPKEWKRRICHHCKTFLYPGENCRIRLNSKKKKGSHVSLTCLVCGNTTRYFIKLKNTDS